MCTKMNAQIWRCTSKNKWPELLRGVSYEERTGYRQRFMGKKDEIFTDER